jgi:hypothetical protein
MRPIRVSVCLVLLTAVLQATAPALARESWSALGAKAAANANAVYSPILESEIRAVVNGTPWPDDVMENCDETGLPDLTRVFVADLYMPERSSVKSAGNSCLVTPKKRNYIVGYATFNSAWLPRTGSVLPAPFYAKNATYSVPTIHLYGVGRVEEVKRTKVVEIICYDMRYAMFLFPDARDATVVRAATQSILSRPNPGYANIPVKVDTLRLAIPQFKMETRFRTSTRSSGVQFVDVAAFVDISHSGIGKPSGWPPLPRHGFIGSGVHASIAFDHPFYFAIVRFDTHSVLFAGYLARPTLNI